MIESASISAIVPARNEEAVIAACIESLSAQPEISEIIAVNDQSSDRTLGILQELAQRVSRLRILDAPPPPAGWVGKNQAVWMGAQQALSEWLLFTDADAALQEGAALKALELAKGHQASLVSFSPEQVLEKWYRRPSYRSCTSGWRRNSRSSR
jgi:glycosyltransferase involved in cell wall biosynthesis